MECDMMVLLPLVLVLKAVQRALAKDTEVDTPYRIRGHLALEHFPCH